MENKKDNKNMKITSITSRGQVVIPQNLRERLKLRTGEKFVAIGEDDTIILKKIKMPLFNNKEELIEKTREIAKNQGIENLESSEVDDAIKKQRKNEGCY